RLTLEQSLPLAPEPLTRLAPAVERPGIHLGVWRENGELRVWGSTQSLPALCLVVEVIAPGLLVMKHSREESGKFANVAVLEGDQLKLLDQQAAAQPGSPLLLKALRSLESGKTTGSGAVLIQMAISMRAHSHGGALLLVPSGTDLWRESIVKPIRYAVVPGFTKLAELMREPPDGRREHHWQEAVRSAVDGIAGLTAVDGAAVITDEYELVAFGATIGRRNGGDEIKHIALMEPVHDSTPVIVPAAQFGGTRHFSAAQFVHDQRDSVALVASKDGQFTVFAWSDPEQIVRAYRIEALLL
ncbi:MAG: putative sensor domain DACNV-containing protein, partial [Terriglobales bacterium]